MGKQIKSELTLLSAAVIWGFAFVAQCMVDTDILGNFSFNGTRFLLGAVSLVPVIFLFEKEKKDNAKLKRTFFASILAGTVLFTASGLQQYGISITHNAGKSGFITGLYIVLVPFLGRIVFKKKTNINTWVAAALALVGLFLLSGMEGGADKISIGDAVILIGAFFWAAHILVIDRFVNEVSPLKFSCMQFAICGLWNVIFALFTENITWSGISATAIPILFTGIMSTGIAYTCQVIGQKGADPNFAVIILSTESVFSAIGGALVLGEVMSFKGYVGCVMIFAGIVISQIKPAKKPAEIQERR